MVWISIIGVLAALSAGKNKLHFPYFSIILFYSVKLLKRDLLDASLKLIR